MSVLSAQSGKGDKPRHVNMAKYVANFTAIKWRNSPKWKKPIKEKKSK